MSNLKDALKKAKLVKPSTFREKVNISMTSVLYAIDNGLVDSVDIDGSRFVLMSSKKTKEYIVKPLSKRRKSTITT
jgi:hypothetical protein